jgi:hypothetical protein
MRIIDLLVIRRNPHFGAPARPSTPEVLQVRERTPTPYRFFVFTFGFVVESINEFGGASSTLPNVTLMMTSSLSTQHQGITGIIYKRCLEDLKIITLNFT